jgi:hypothetical protein
MKNVFLYVVFLLMGYSSFGQGVDVVFLLDNSLNIDGYTPTHAVNPGSEYEKMHHSINALMDYILECSTYNRVTTVQHCDGHEWGTLTRVDSDFVNDTVAFTRDFNVDSDKLEESLDFVSDRLLGIPYTSIYGPSISLNAAPGNKLVVVIFNEYSRTDQLRTDGTVPPFASFDDFKALHNATIMYIHINGSSTNIKSAAAIASLGGTYTGPVESYSSDPYGPGATPRYYWNTNDYQLSVGEIEIIGQEICSAWLPPCETTLVLTTAAGNDVISPDFDFRQASNSITASNVVNSGATGIYHAQNTVVLKPGFHSKNASKFWGYIAGCTDDFDGLSALAPPSEEEYSMTTMSVEEEKLFTLSPNPATESVTVASDKVMINVSVASATGIVLFNRDVKSKSYDVNLTIYPKGFYIVTVTAEDGTIETKKLIKN